MSRNLLLLIVLCICFNAKGQDINTKTTRLIIIHPTRLVVSYYSKLVEKSLLPDSIEYLGIYHSDEEYDYRQLSDLYLPQNFKFKIIEIKGKITDNDVYEENSCTFIFDSLFNISDGIIFNGGPDIQSVLYQQETSLLTEITDPVRHQFEMSFMFHLLGSERNRKYSPLIEKKPDYMIIGICLGMQTMVAATGGTLIQDIPSEVYKIKTAEQIIKSGKQHSNYYRHLHPNRDDICPGYLHALKVDENFPLWKNCLWTENVQVYSNHHQAAGRLPDRFKAIAWSDDKKVIEAVVHITYKNVLGVQFHPELSALYNPDIKIYPAEGDTLTLGSLIENDKETLNFHHAFWKQITIMIIK